MADIDIELDESISDIEVIPIYGPTGAIGNGIVSIAKTGTSGNVDIYTITYTNGDTDEFTVTNAYQYQEGDGIIISGTTISVDDTLVVMETEKGAINGVAELGADGKVPSSQLPSFVDDVIELLTFSDTEPLTCAEGDIYYNTGSKELYTATDTDTWSATGEEPEKSKIYVTLDTNYSYRWSGSLMINLASPVQAATESTSGIAEIATSGEVSTGTDNTRIVTPLKLSEALASYQPLNTAVTHSASTAVGSTTKGVYIASDGTATAMTYSVNKDVPSDAAFTDTTYTFSTGLTENSGTVAVTDYNKLVKNTATGYNAIGIGDNVSASSDYGLSNGSIASGYCVSIGNGSRAKWQSVAIGNGAQALGEDGGSIQIGAGTNSVNNTFNVGFGYAQTNYQLLDGTTGLIPDARISSNIARTSALSSYQTTSNLVTSISSLSTDTEYPSAKCVYDIIGNIESLLSQV